MKNDNAEKIGLGDIIMKCTNDYGWINYVRFDEWMEANGFTIKVLERHNRTDGEVHYRYTHIETGSWYDFNGNYYNYRTFSKIIEWIVKNEFKLQ